MAWSYDATTLDTSKRNQVRFKLGDTVSTDALLQDEEIDYLLSQNNDVVLTAAIEGCLAIITALSGAVDFSIGPYSESQGDRLKNYQTLYRILQAQTVRLNTPLSEAPTTEPIFYYGMLSNAGVTDE